MGDLPQATEPFWAYLQLDDAVRRTHFAAFVQALKNAGSDEGRLWAVRAVSPLLDYSSLIKLRRFLTSKTLADPPNALRLAILGGPTTLQLRQLIEVFLAGAGIAAEIYEAEYGLFRQEILTPGSALDSFRPEVIFLATSARDVARLPALYQGEEDVSRLAAEEVGDWLGLWETARARWQATVIQNNFEIGPENVFGHYRLRHAAARENYLERLNRLFAESAPAHVVLHDLRGLADDEGRNTWFDPRFYLEFKMPCSAECLVPYAHSVVSLVSALRGRSKKAVVLDLDNTLWGGVVGETGSGGICLGDGSGEGEAFLGFQRFLKSLHQRGVVLAVCSKNDEEKAREPFLKRHDMILKLSDFSCFVANWQNKADNLRTISERLELNLDSFVFVDDSPSERALVRRSLPEVAVPDLPGDPAEYIQALTRHRYFETAVLTREDLSRARYYAENAQRTEMASRSTDLNAFLSSLDMRMKLEPVNELNVERATQLINKSNQFNLTTRRYTVAQLREIAVSGDWRTLTFSLRDNLGDNGLISVVLLSRGADFLAIDTWVMSCRVLQRGAEQLARNALVELAMQEGVSTLLGTFIPSPRNAMVKSHFAEMGFDPAGVDGDKSLWSLRINPNVPPLSTCIRRAAADE